MRGHRLIIPALLVVLPSIVGLRPASAQADASVWPESRFDPHQTAFNADEHALTAQNVSGLRQEWVLDRTTSAPAVWGDSLFVESLQLLRLDLRTGALEWSTPETVAGVPVLWQGLVYVGASSHMYAFDPETGHVVWDVDTFHLGDELATVTVSHGTVFAGGYDPYTVDSHFFAFGAKTGNLRWLDAREERMTLYTPAVGHGVVYLDGDNGYMDAVRADTGEYVWTIYTNNYSASSPAVGGDKVYVGNSDGNVYAYDAATGQQAWASPVGAIGGSSPALAYGMVYIGSYETGEMYALDAQTGEVRWSAPTDGAPGSPVVAGGVVYVGGTTGVQALDAMSGLELWSAPTPGVPVVAHGMLFVAGDQLVAYGL